MYDIQYCPYDVHTWVCIYIINYVCNKMAMIRIFPFTFMHENFFTDDEITIIWLITWNCIAIPKMEVIMKSNLFLKSREKETLFRDKDTVNVL